MLLAFFLLFAQPAPIERGLAALDRNDLPTAQASFEEATRASPSDPKAWFLLAQTLAKRGNQRQAADAAAKAEQFSSNDREMLQRLANFYGSALGDLPHAASLGSRYASLTPADTEAWRRVAALYLAIGKPDEAIQAALKGKPLDPSPELRVILGKAYLARKDWTNAEAELDAALRLNPYDEDLWFTRAQINLLRQDFSGAEKVLLDAKKTFARSAQIELALGVVYYGQRKFPLAVDQFLKTIPLAPDAPQPYAFLGRILEHAGDRLPEVTQSFAAFETRHPESPLGYMLHAKVLIRQLPPSGFPPEAEQAAALLEKSLKLQEADADAQYLSGLLADRKGDLTRAAAHLERATQLNAKDSAAHFQLARVYNKLGRKEDAARERALHEKLSQEEQTASQPPPRP